MTPAEAKPFLYAVDAAIASHNAAITSLRAMRAVVEATVHEIVEATVHESIDATVRAAAPAVALVAPVIAPPPIDPAPRAPQTRKGKGGRPRKHFANRPATDAERVAISRAGRRVTKLNPGFVTGFETCFETPLSDSKSFLNIRNLDLEREGVTKLNPGFVTGSFVTGAASVAPGRRVSLPPDFEPDAQRAKAALDKLGETRAANLLQKFRSHYRNSGVKLTLAGWQDKFEKWIIGEEEPFARPIAGGYRPKSLAATADELIARAVERKLDPQWLPIFTRLKATVGEGPAVSWFARAQLGEIVDGCAKVIVPTLIAKSTATSKYAPQVLNAIAAEHPGTVRVEFTVEPPDRSERVAS